MRKPIRNLVIAVPAALVMATAAACGSSAASPSSTTPTATGSGASSSNALQVTSNSSLGQIVTNNKGVTVYRYDLDTVNSGKSNCYGSCAAVWPAVTVTGSGTPKVSGVSQHLVGEITRTNGAKQLTIAGSPVYTYTGDSGAGSTNGQGFSGIWWAVTPTGAKAAATTGGTSPSTGGGGGY